MIRNDGTFKFYVLECQTVDNLWTRVYIDSYNFPGFTVDDPCYKDTGIRGTYNYGQAINAQTQLRMTLNKPIRITEVTISQEQLPKSTGL